jgi:site-specific recombinase XerD
MEGMAGIRLMAAATDDDRKQALIALCGMCGLRVFEAVEVTFSDFQLQGVAKPILTVRGKGDVTRHVPVSSEAMNLMVMALGRSMVTGCTLVRMGNRFARKVVTNLGAAAGLSRSVSSHDLRATFATAVYNKTLDQRLVQNLLGHKSGKTTEGYIGVAMEAMISGVEGL